ncbi:MAG: hypothetical protein U0Y08_06745 [Bacteroidia bacterium]
MKKLICLAAGIFLYSLPLKAQFPLTAEVTGKGGQQLFVRSPESLVFGNACTLDSLPRLSFGLSSARSYLLPELSEYSAGIRMKLPASASFMCGLAVKGFSLFRYQELGASLSKKFGKTFCAALGIAHYSIRQGEGNGTFSVYSMKAGLQVKLSQVLEAASGCKIPLRRRAEMPADDFSIALRYRFSNLFALQSEVAIHALQTGFLISLQYRPHPRVEINLAGGGYPFRMAFGCELESRALRFRIGALYSPQPGLSPAAGAETSGLRY